ncbi:MAG: FG-GAP repeat protein [Cytophagales bacterium]
MHKLTITFICLCTISNAQFIDASWESTWLGGSSFSSVRTTDLNDDGIEDIVVGAGIENQESKLGILAIDGSKGDTL